MGKDTMRQELMDTPMKDLLLEAKSYNVVGRHRFSKGQLVEALLVKMEAYLASGENLLLATLEMSGAKLEQEALEASSGVEALEEVLVKGAKVDEHWEGSGPVVFGVGLGNSCKSKYIEQAKPGAIVAFRVDERKVLSGIIEEVHALEFVIRTKNGVKFTVRKRNVIWVRTGPRWPRGVYLALKGEVDVENSRLGKADSSVGAKDGGHEAGVRRQSPQDSGIL